MAVPPGREAVVAEPWWIRGPTLGIRIVLTDPNNMRVSIVIPCLNEGRNLDALLESLQSCRREGHELLLVDGGSDDGTLGRVARLLDHLIVSDPGRARQMNAGAAGAEGDILWFLHADSRPPDHAVHTIISSLGSGDHAWGRFDITMSGSHRMLRLVEFMMNWRSRLTGIATGDQGIFVERRAFVAAGGFPEIPLMEDIALCRALKRISAPRCLSGRMVTSSRRWETQGVYKTILLMWRLRLAYALGVDPGTLERRYHQCSSPTRGS